MNISKFEKLIKEKTGLSFENGRLSILKDAVYEMMTERNMESLGKYLKFITNNQNEFFDLVNLLTVNETYFFREPVYIKLFSEKLIPELLKLKCGEKIKILSAGCSTGEEAYSLLMALVENYGRNINNLFSITGVDIDSRAIESAKHGIYRKQSFRAFEPDMQMRYFKSIGKGRYRIKSFLKDVVDFHNVNLLSLPYPDALKGADIIFYRNVSIYFEPEIQKSIFNNLAQILNDNGYLIVSSTETLSHDMDILSLVELNGTFLYHKNIKSDKKNTTLSTLSAPLKPKRSASKSFFNLSYLYDDFKLKQKLSQQPSENPLDQNCVDMFKNAKSLAEKKKYQEAIDILDNLIQEDFSFVRAYTLKASILINLQEMGKARKICLKAIELNRLYMEGYLLLGIIAKFENNPDEAMTRFRETLYINSQCWLAYFYMAEIHKAKGKSKAASHAYETVLKLIKKGQFKNHGLTFFPFSFSEEQVIRVCEHKK
ncbi:chemotaxis protein methyltransferase CheR [Candidatus Magnetomoraceae bacterium gMMP-15]